MTRLSNAGARFIRSLHRRKGREAEGCFVVEGERAVSEVVDDPGLRFLFGTAERAVVASTLAPDVPYYVIDDVRLFATENPQGIGAVLTLTPDLPLSNLLPLAPLLALDGVADPGNVGTIIRTAEWFGFGGVVLLPGTADPFSPKSVRSSLGAIVRCGVAPTSIAELLDCGLELIGLDAAGDLTIGRDPLPTRAVYIIGSEAHGLTPELRPHIRLAAIPGHGRVESLNAAMASAIVCYEVRREGT